VKLTFFKFKNIDKPGIHTVLQQNSVIFKRNATRTLDEFRMTRTNFAKYVFEQPRYSIGLKILTSTNNIFCITTAAAVSQYDKFDSLGQLTSHPLN